MYRSLIPILSLALLGLVQVDTASAADSPTDAAGAAEPPQSAIVGAASAAPSAIAKKRTRFAYANSGYGTYLTGGDVPVESKHTARVVVGCTNLAGIRRENTLASIDLPGIGVANGLSTRTFTQAKGSGRSAVHTSRTVQTIASVNLLDTVAGSIDLTGLRTVAKASHSNGRFHSSTSHEIAGLTLTTALGITTDLPLPTTGSPVVVPGLATISLGAPVRKEAGSKAVAVASSLRIEVVPTDTAVRLGNARATLRSGVKRGVLGGYAAGVRAHVLGDLVSVGRTPTTVMPCLGTGGETKTNSIASVDLGPVLGVEALQASQRGKVTDRAAYGVEVGRVARVTLGGRIDVRGVEGRAFVKRTRRGVVARRATTELASITVDGKAVRLDPGTELTVPGVASLRRRVVKRRTDSVEVVGLRVTLLDGSGATVDLGIARTGVKPGRIYR